jgi:phage shock protein E
MAVHWRSFLNKPLKTVDMLSFIKNIFRKKESSLEQVLNRGAIILDVRSEAEFRQGHVEGARNIPLHALKLREGVIRSWKKPVITVCQSGSRSRSAKIFLDSIGIESHNGGAWAQFNSRYGS